MSDNEKQNVTPTDPIAPIEPFKVDIDFGDFGEAVPEAPFEKEATSPEQAPPVPETLEPLPPRRRKKKKKKRSLGVRILLVSIYVIVVVSVAVFLGLAIRTAVVEVFGITPNDMLVDVTIPKGATTAEVAEILKEEGVIEHPLIFRAYSRLTDADGTYQPGDFTVSAAMGYEYIIKTLQSEQQRETVSITFPEGSTLADIAELLEYRNVCSKKDFYEALESGDFSDYPFIAEIPASENRLHKMEGYLFPDTYDFYVEGSAVSAVRRFLDNFNSKIYENTKLIAAMKAKGLSLDELLTLASIVQLEDDSAADIEKVSRVFWNRLDSVDYPRLQSDITQEYVGEYDVDDREIADAYDTYVCVGLPVGPICNPGLAAVEAAAFPSNDEDVVGCYFFASDIESGKTFYSRTLAEHEAICRQYGIGMYG